MQSHSEKWDDRYTECEALFGNEPNQFLVEQAELLPASGTALCLAEGQGRNAVWLAKRGLQVTAVDFSKVGLEMAQRFAAEHQVAIVTMLADLAEYPIQPRSWDVIVSIWCHLPSSVRVPLYARVAAGLKPGGVFVLEAYTPAQIVRSTGGPKDPDMLASLETLKAELPGLELVAGLEMVRDVQEGNRHVGLSDVVQLVARKR